MPCSYLRIAAVRVALSTLKLKKEDEVITQSLLL